MFYKPEGIAPAMLTSFDEDGTIKVKAWHLEYRLAGLATEIRKAEYTDVAANQPDFPKKIDFLASIEPEDQIAAPPSQNRKTVGVSGGKVSLLNTPQPILTDPCI